MNFIKTQETIDYSPYFLIVSLDLREINSKLSNVGLIDLSEIMTNVIINI